MGALPKQRIPKSRKGNRRSHHALKKPAIVNCGNCGETKRPHFKCANCGKMRKDDRVKAQVEAAKSKKKEAKKSDDK